MDCGESLRDSQQGNVKPSFLIAELDDPRDLVAGWSYSGMVFGGDERRCRSDGCECHALRVRFAAVTLQRVGEITREHGRLRTAK